MKQQGEYVEGTPIRVQVPSSIHGVGAVASRRIRKGELISAPKVRWGGFNHSCDPNLGPRVEEGKPVRAALRDIGVGEELTVSYNKLNGHAVVCKCKTCGGRQVSWGCNCPIHRRGKILHSLIQWFNQLKFWR